MRTLLLIWPAAFLWMACIGGPPADATGGDVYEQICSNCHGSDLSGGVGPPLDAGSNAATQDDSFLELTIKRGRGRMPSFQNTLTDEQIQRVISFIREQQQ